MMISRVPPSALSDLRPGCWLACPARSLVSVQERGTAGAAARGRRATPDQAKAPARLGRPSGHGCADPAAARKAADAPAGDAWHRLAVAPPPGHPEVDLPEPDGPAAGQRRDRCTDRAARHREQQLGIQEDPRRVAQARSPGRRVHDPPGPQEPEDPPGTDTAYRHALAAVPARARRDNACYGLLSRGLRSNPLSACIAYSSSKSAPATCTSSA